MQHTDKARAEFETWFSAEWRNRSPLMQGLTDEQWDAVFSGLTVKDEDGRYLNIVPRECFIAWQASRAELVVELPQMVAFEGAYDSLRSSEYSDHQGDLTDADEVFGLCRLIEAREAIEAAGVTIKE